MGRRKWIWALSAAVLIAVAAGLWVGMPTGSAPLASLGIPKASRALSLANLQTLATQSCKCARSAADETARKGCWFEFERIKAANPTGTVSVSPCGSLSPQWSCFGGTIDDCVITKYSYRDEVSVCTAEEAQEVEAALAKAYKAGRYDELAIMKRFERAYREGRKPKSAFEGGCTG